jgi:stage II sporulation protein P
MRRKSTRRKKKKLLVLILLFWCISALTCAGMLKSDIADSATCIEQEIGKHYLAAAFPAISRGGGDGIREVPVLNKAEGSLIVAGSEYKKAEEEEEGVDEERLEGILDSVSLTEPLVLIYHTHATESYQPVSEGNFHTVEEKGTVREVGAVLKASLEAKGISVLHDKAIHDSPSYSKSYSRSLEAIKKILGTNPSVRIIIDLHRDAASYKGNNKQAFTVGDKTAAQFCLVVGEGNENSQELKEFANKINQTANRLYPGFSKGIILKEYKYNQYIADDYILLEMGNNQNHIDEARLSATLFADVIEEVLKGM